MQNLILIEGEEYTQFNDLESLVKSMIDNNFYKLSNKEKLEILEKKAFLICQLANAQLVNFKEYNISNYKDEDIFVIYDEITYILSMLKIGKWCLLEKKEANILVKDIDKEDIEENYIIVNNFTDRLLERYLGDLKNE